VEDLEAQDILVGLSRYAVLPMFTFFHFFNSPLGDQLSQNILDRSSPNFFAHLDRIESMLYQFPKTPLEINEKKGHRYHVSCSHCCEGLYVAGNMLGFAMHFWVDTTFIMGI